MISKQPVEAEALARGAKATRTGRQLDTQRLGAKGCTATFGRTKSEDHRLMEQVVERNNLRLAYQRVIQNKGAPGVDSVNCSTGVVDSRWPGLSRTSIHCYGAGSPISRSPKRRVF